MEISLYALVDNDGRIIYTSSHKIDVDNKKLHMKNLYNDKTEIVELKGEYNVRSR